MDANIVWAKITACWESITRQVRFPDHGDYLVSKGVFTLEDLEHLRTKTGRDQTIEMLLVMHRKRPDAAFHFIASLRRECPHVANEIEDHEVDTQVELDNNTTSYAGETESRFVMEYMTGMKCKQLQTQVEELQDTLKTTEESKSLLKSQLRELQGELDTMKKHKQTLESQVQQLQGDVQTNKHQLEKQATEIQGELKSANDSNNNLKTEVDRIKGDMQSMRNNKQALENQAKELQGKVNTTEDSAKILEIKSKKLQGELHILKIHKQTLEIQVKSLQGDVHTCKQELENQAKEFQGKMNTTEDSWERKNKELERKMNTTEDSWERKNKELERELEMLTNCKQQLGSQIEELQESKTWELVEGWETNIEVEKSNSRMTEEMENEVMALTKQAVINSLGDLQSFVTFVGNTFNGRHGKYWHCVVGPIGAVTYIIWPNTHDYITLRVKLASINKSLRLILFKAHRNEWFYPVGWKNDIKVNIGKSKMPASLGEEAKELVLQAVRGQSAVDTVGDMSDIAKFIRDTWEKTHAGYWQAVAGEMDRYCWSVRLASESYIYMYVELTAVKEKMEILLFKAEQDK